MAKTILQIVNEARIGTSLPRVTSLFSADARRNRVVEIAELAILETQEDFLKRNWSGLETKATITSVADQEAYDLPSDYHHALSETFWTNRMRGVGPVMPKDWRYFKNWRMGGTMHPRWRVVGSTIEIFPAPTADGQVYEIDYVSDAMVYGADGYVWGSFSWGLGYWNAASASSGYKSAFNTNNDTFKLDETVLRKGIRWRMLRDSGKPYAVEEEEYRRSMDVAQAMDRGGPGTVNVGHHPASDPGLFTTIGENTDSNYPSEDATI